MDKDFIEKFNVLRKGYLNKLKDNLPSFRALLDENPINIAEIYSRVHTLSGTCGMYELPELSKLSVNFETYIKPIKENPDLINIEEFKNKFVIYLDNIETVILGE